MDLIYHRGLDCHLASIINIVASLDINYRNAFFNLWSETDFTYDLQYQVFLSKRVLVNLESLGARIEALNCDSPEEAEEKLSLLPDGELFLVGMDNFYIPWSHVYQNFYEPHYFYARKENADDLFCFDPLYNKKNAQIKYIDILNHAFDLRRIRKIEVEAPQIELKQEAQRVLHSLPKIQEKLRDEILACKNADRQHIHPTIKRIIAMINNRYLFERYLHQPSSDCDPGRRFFEADFFSRWEAVKNGLYKASATRKNGSVVDEVCDLFLNLLHQETAMAEQIVMGD